jgi:Na+/H+ antiporter NhaD/arsenite permease-like protein
MRAPEGKKDPTAEYGGDSTLFALEKGDAFYFLISLACSSNIGSALTYTGNPQVDCINIFIYSYR